MIYQKYGKSVYFFLLSLCREPIPEEELTQETMLPLYADNVCSRESALH